MPRNFLIDRGSSLKNSLKAYYKLEELSDLRWDEITPGTGPSAQFTSANSEYLSVTDPANLRVGTASFTISCWVYFDSKSASGNGVVSKSDGLPDANREYDISYDGTAGNDDLEFHFYTSTGAFSARATSIGSPSNATWYFIVAWYDSNYATVNIQVNNGTVHSSSVTGTPNAVSGSEFAIGRYSPGTPLYLNGRIGQMGIWKRRLTQAERTTLYNGGSGRNSREISSSIRELISSYWNLNEVSGSRSDAVGANTLTDNNTVTQAAGVSAGNTLTDNNTVTRSSTAKQGYAAQFTAANTEYLSGASNADFQTGDISWSAVFWVRLDSKTSNRGFIAKHGSSPSSQREYQVIYQGGATDRFRFQWYLDALDNLAQVDANNFGSPSTSTWYMIHVYHDAVNDLIGISVNNGTANTTAANGGNTGSFAFKIGQAGTSEDQYMDGQIDEVGIWKRLLTSLELEDLYNGGSGNTIVADGDAFGVDIARKIATSSFILAFN